MIVVMEVVLIVEETQHFNSLDQDTNSHSQLINLVTPLSSLTFQNLIMKTMATMQTHKICTAVVAPTTEIIQKNMVKRFTSNNNNTAMDSETHLDIQMISTMEIQLRKAMLVHLQCQLLLILTSLLMREMKNTMLSEDRIRNPCWGISIMRQWMIKMRPFIRIARVEETLCTCLEVKVNLEVSKMVET